MSQKKIKCAVYKNEAEWGGGQWFIPGNHFELRNLLRNDGFMISWKPIGIFEFEESFLNSTFQKQIVGESPDQFVWDDTFTL